MKQTFEGMPAGTGAIYAGAGTAAAELTFKPQGDQTAVTWSMPDEDGR
jgi:hypothetical protein